MARIPQFYTFALLRSPLCSLSQLRELCEAPDEVADERLWLWFTHPLTERALYVASPALYQVWQDWQQSPDTRPTLAARLALWRYAIRMSSRSTPFGLMAGVSMVTVSTRTNGEGEQDRIETVVRPDTAWLSALVEKLVESPAVRGQLRYQVNNSLYVLGTQLRYSDYKVEGGQRVFFINAIEPDETVTELLQYVRAQTGGITGQALCTWLQEKFGEKGDEASRLVNELIDAHVLVSELEPNVTGLGAFERLVERLGSVPSAKRVSHCLQQLHEQLHRPFESVDEEKRLDQTMRQLLGECCPPGSLRQVDLHRSTERLTLNQTIVGQIGGELVELSVLRTERQSPALLAFAQQFYARYDRQAQPLLLALDHESGIGYGTGRRTGSSALLRALVASDCSSAKPQSDRLDALRLDVLTRFLKTGDSAQTLTEEDLKRVAQTTPASPLARSWAVLGELYGTGPEAMDKGDYQFLVKSVAGPSGASLMARFGTGNPELAKALQQITDWEAAQQPDGLLAEIVHLPTGRIGNVVHRPTLRSYEIPYVTPPSVSETQTLLLEDLWVRVPDGVTVEIWSKTYNQRVLPRNTTAHNYHGSDEVYRFLSDLGHQDESFSFSWSWSALSEQSRLPRVVYKHLIVARAQWTLTWCDQWPTAKAMVIDMQQRLALPNQIVLVESDNELLLELTADACRQILFDELRKKRIVRAVEWLANSDECWLQRRGHPYRAELLIPYRVPRPAPLPSPSPFDLSSYQPIQRTYLPGSEWLYVKVYVGEQIANTVLTQVVAPLVEQAIREGWMDHWFFIRYYDPHPHLRLRFHCTANGQESMLKRLSRCLQTWVDDGRVQAVQVDTYERELERYGYTTISYCEQLFWLDSEHILEGLCADSETDEPEQWLIACRRANALMRAFGLSLDEKYQLMITLQDHFLKENKVNPELRSQLNEQYRLWLRQLRGQAIDQNDEATEMGTSLRHIVQLLLDELENKNTQPSKMDILTSLLHMQCNRYFVSEQRLSESVVYHFLLRHFASEAGRIKRENVQNL